ncbi:hypothetical protein JCM17823_03080 [Halorubrum gandharaense]
MIDTLLIPTDGSETATNAARWGFALAERLDARICVLSVADVAVATGAGYAGNSASIRSTLRETADKRATALADAAREHGLEATTVVHEGVPAAEIVEHAAADDIDAIVMGTSGRGGVARTLMGSVADKVVRTAPVPVMTANADAVDGVPVSPVDDVLVPTDGSDAADEAAAYALDLAAALGATAHLLTVIDEATANAVADHGEGPSDEGAESRLDGLVSAAEEHGVDTTTAIETGDPADRILAYSDRESVDIVVMGTAGRGMIERAVTGSVADAVVRRASQPVMTVGPGMIERD